MIGMVASIALVVGYFLPWTSDSSLIESAFAGTGREIAKGASKDEAAAGAVAKLREGQAISGAAWASILEAALASGDLDERQQRRVSIAENTLEYLPWVTGGLALLLLMLSLPAAKVARLGGLPASTILGIVQSRLIAGILMPIVMLLGLVVLTTMGTVMAASKLSEDDPGRTGIGVLLMVGGSAVALLSGFFGFGPGRFKALLVVLILYLGVVGFVTYRVAQ